MWVARGQLGNRAAGRVSRCFVIIGMARLALLLLRLAAMAALHCLASRAEGQRPSVAICVAIKDQAVDVREWVHYHRAIGAGGPGRL